MSRLFHGPGKRKVRVCSLGYVPEIILTSTPEVQCTRNYVAAAVFAFSRKCMSLLCSQVKSVINLLFAAYTGDVSALRRYARWVDALWL